MHTARHSAKPAKDSIKPFFALRATKCLHLRWRTMDSTAPTKEATQIKGGILHCTMYSRGIYGLDTPQFLPSLASPAAGMMED